MHILDTVRGRRSIRRYEDRPVPRELVDQLLEAVRWAPSGGNTQPWEVVEIRDPAVKEALQDTVAMTNPGRRAVLEAPVLMAVCGKVKIPDTYRQDVTTKFGDWWFMFHLGVASQNLCLTAHALGLGTLMVGFFDHDQAAEILCVPEGYEVVVLIPVGYPARVPAPPPRRELREFVHKERFRSPSRSAVR